MDAEMFGVTAASVVEWLEQDWIDEKPGRNKEAVTAINALIAERDALRTLLAAARAHMLGAGDGYENEVVVAISAALESNTKT